MSHFVVAVFHEEGQSVEKLLEPYYEGNTRAPWIEFSRQEAIDYVRKNYSGFVNCSDDECWEYMSTGYITDRAGNLYTTSNPDGKWDWWVEGGRWEGLLRLKNGERVNSARIRDIDFSLDDKVYDKALRFWDIVVEHEPLEAGEEAPLSLWKEDYYREYYVDRETYARRQAQFSTFAVINANGIWEEKARCGLFGMSDETPERAASWEDNFFEMFIKGKEDLYLTIVDCHV